MPKFSYTNIQGQNAFVEATSPEEALKIAPNIAPHSGVQLEPAIFGDQNKTGIQTSDSITNKDTQTKVDQLKADADKDAQIASLVRDAKIAELKKQLTGEVKEPTTPNYVESFKNLRVEQGISDIETQLTGIRDQKRQLQDEVTKYKRDISGLGSAEGVVQSAVSQKANQAQDELDKLSRQEALLIDTLNNKNNYISTLMELTSKDYAVAKQEADDTFNKNYQVQQLYNTQATEEQKNAQTFLGSISTLISNSGTNWDSINNSMKANIYQQELKAGWVPGTLETFSRMEPKANLLATVNGYTQSGQGITTFIYSDENGNPAIAKTVNNLTYQKPKESELLGGLTSQQRTYLNQMQDNARVDPNIKDFPAVRASYETAKSSAEKKSGTGDIVLMRMIAKITDPTTGVREEEFATFESAQSTLAKFGVSLTTRMWTGNRLTEYGRNQLMQSVEDIYNQRKAAYDTSYRFFESQSTNAGIPPGLVMPYYVAPTGVEGNENDKSYIEQLEKSGFKIKK